MDRIVERCCGLDVHKDTVVACVRTAGEGGKRRQEVRTFGATTAALLALRDWLVAERVSLVGMESTGVYWKCPYYVLEDDIECWLLNARHLRNVPGRKTDVGDAEWICQLVEHGLVRPSFVPPKPIRELRNLTRYRKAQIEERGREAQRLDKVLQDAGVKLSSVATDIQGKSARAMLAALVEGERDPEVLAQLARGRMRAKVPQLEEALVGRFGAHHALLVRTIVAKVDFLDRAIEDLSVEIDRVIAPFAAEVQLLRTITGIDRRAAEGIIAEIGVDMGRFPTSGHLASWAGMCPGNHESGGKRHGGRSRKGSKWLAALLAEVAAAAGHSKGTYLGAQHRRLTGRIGYTKANKAVGHSILAASWHVLSNRVPYDELGADWFIKRRPDAHARRLARQIEALGFTVTITPSAAA
jgi:transposase